MKISKHIAAILLAGLITVSCSDWLDKKTPMTGNIPQNLAYSSVTNAEGVLTGIYDLLRMYNADGGRHVSYGYKHFTLGFDFMANDIISNPSQWWTYEAQWSEVIRVATGYRANQIWRFWYVIINNANSFIDGVTASTSIPESAKPALLGEAKAIRAFSYFNLVRVMQFTYKGNENKPGVPIYKKGTTEDIEGQPRSTVQQVYDFILNENLTDADINAIPTDSEKYKINRNVALGIRANVHLYMENWTAAAADAKSARQGYPLMNESTYKSSGFNTISTGEWMWGAPFRPDQALLWASFFSHVDMERPQNGYKNFYINTTFINKFSSTDYRKMFKTPSVNVDPNWGLYTSTKFKDRQPDADGDYVYMRASEMYLIEAEAKARLNAADAGDVLFELQSARDPGAVRSGNTGQSLVDEILLERRKELYGEIGVEYFDLKRYNKPMVRDGIHSLMFNVPAGDKRWNYQIPTREFTTNPALNPDTDQNP
ncbi:MAG: RagB/SusD family nutrient uptake outer membrane protein [Prevotellaceae bacterium]|jgi:hypothetical protein|nr:RagB/SusD family nutrient uptake outer membrane protein [Prevotellaceae bacterium]